jgi:hypothetical protein
MDISITTPFFITTYYTQNQLGLVDVGNATGFTAIVGTIAIATVSVIPTSYKVLENNVNYTITFNNTYLIPLKGYIVLQIPTNVTIAINYIHDFCRLSINNAPFTSATCTAQTFPSYYTITFTNLTVL